MGRGNDPGEGGLKSAAGSSSQERGLGISN